MKIINENGKIGVDCPYLPDFPSAAKKIGGKWDPNCKMWFFDGRDSNLVEKLLNTHYGYCTEGAQTCEIEITAKRELGEYRTGLYAGGRLICSATGRDSGARLGAGVVCVSGASRSGGSVKNWRTEITAGSVFLVHDFVESAISKIDDDDWDVKILSAKNENEKLIAEREKLLTRIAEIDLILGGVK